MDKEIKVVVIGNPVGLSQQILRAVEQLRKEDEIIAVYKPKSDITSSFDLDVDYLDCIWERPLTRKQGIEKQIKESQKELEEIND